jgi:hypothetical protein
MKLKQSVKDKLQALLVLNIMVIFAFVGIICISIRNQQFDKKMTEMHTIQISQN